MKKNSIQINLFILFFILLATVGCQSNKNELEDIQSITIGIQNSPSNALVIIADEKGFFDSTQIKVQVKEFSAGKLALQALLSANSDLDAAVSAETPVVLSSLAGNQLKIITQIVDVKNECRMVVRKDDDLITPEQYFSKKRKITTSQGGSPEWITWNFIQKYKLNQTGNIELIYMLPENMPIAVKSNSVDGCSIFDPYARITEKELGQQGLTFLNEDLRSYYVVNVKSVIINKKKQALIALINGLKKAENYISAYPEESQSIIAKRTKLDKNIVQSTWNNYTFKLSLDEALIKLCNAEAAWAIETNKYPKSTKIPDFNQVIDRELLQSIAEIK